MWGRNKIFIGAPLMIRERSSYKGRNETTMKIIITQIQSKGEKKKERKLQQKYFFGQQSTQPVQGDAENSR